MKRYCNPGGSGGSAASRSGGIVGSGTPTGQRPWRTAAGNGPDHGTFTFDTDRNTYTYDPTDGYTGDDSVTVNVTDDQGQTTQHTIQFHLA